MTQVDVLASAGQTLCRVIRQHLRLFRWHVLRYLARHPLLALLNVASVGLGVAVYLAIQIANGSANRAFAATIDVVAGKADLQITRAAGGLPDEIFPKVAHCPGVAAATPLVRGFITLPDVPGEYLHVLGLDIFTNESFRTFALTDFHAGQFDVQRWLGDANAIAVTDEFARLHHLKSGDRLRVQLNGTDRELTVGFILQTNGAAVLDPHFAAMDIGWAQELFARRGSLSAIQLRLTNPRERDSVIAALRPLVPVDATISTPAQRGEQVENMLRAFQLNLTAMSLVSLLVGMFLIYNTVSASVVRRRHEIGILRSLGTTRREIRALFLGEALVLGIAGTLVGLLGGIYLARALVGTVSETISSLYVLLSVRQLALTPAMFLSAIVAGLFSVLLAAWLPARAAARMDPVQALRAGTIIEQSAGLSRAWFWSGLVAIAFCRSFFRRGAAHRAAVDRIRRGLLCPGRFFAACSGNHQPLQRDSVTLFSRGRAASGRGKSGAIPCPQFHHDCRARRRGCHGHRRERDGFFLSANSVDLDRANGRG